jgi:hypothetical protein
MSQNMSLGNILKFVRLFTNLIIEQVKNHI